MAVEHQLARLTAGAPWGLGSGGSPEISKDEVRGALATRWGKKLCPRYSLILEFENFGTSGELLFREIEQHFRADMIFNNWQKYDKESLGGFEFSHLVATVAWMETWGGSRCTKCHGIPDTPCQQCKGRGVLPLTDRWKADFLRLKPSNYSRTWKPRVQRLEMDVESWRRMAWDRLARAIYGPKEE